MNDTVLTVMEMSGIPNYVAYADHLYWALSLHVNSVDIGNDSCVFSRVSVHFLISSFHRFVCLHILIIFGNTFNIFALI